MIETTAWVVCIGIIGASVVSSFAIVYGLDFIAKGILERRRYE